MKLPEKFQLQMQSLLEDEYIENAVIAPIFDNAGNTINYLALYDDITEQRKAEA